MSQSGDTTAAPARAATQHTDHACFSVYDPIVTKKTILVLTGVLLSSPGVGIEAARAEESMRCGSRLVSRGDAKDKVRTLCGEPTDVALRGVVRRSPTYHYGYGIYGYDFYGPGWIDLPVEIWTYNLGPHKLLRKLRFIGDELDDIRTDGYGY
jgi:hypothetical protein